MTLTTPTISYLSSDFYFAQDALTARENESIHELRSFLEAEVAPIADDYWERAEFPMHLIKPLADIGAYGALWEESRQFENSAKYRGWAALESGRVDASVSTFIGVTSGLAMGSIGVGGSPEQRAEWLPKLATGELVGAFGLTEPLSGSDSAGGLRTTATRHGDSWTLNGAKRWIGNATFADVIVIWARDTADNQVKGFLVTSDSPGFTATKIERKQSLRMVQNADITLTDVKVPEERRLQLVNSFKDTAKVLLLTRADVAWQAIGNSIGAYEAAVAYVKEREQFGKTLSSFQLVQDLLSRALGNISSSIALCMQTSDLLDQGRQTDAHASMAKQWATSRMRETVGWCREVMGGNGIVLDYGVARRFADAEAIYSFEGTREMNSLIVGRAITGKSAFVS
ncbi:acyl-CoA dehydrogenase [Frondihabitans sp. PAMC 28766]|uniref:acyl-CoA dehydrogenase family protein n=1 Tax=Frondihabitans sp. PAMC 28766 TaxID=1795630 RepID=UPI00078C7E54|nr:acyl-CoA dehydrogenase family protein [Frondihabitans sp. PAMC 28766]AMM22379.1 acyl-CoA dehydrogenase [Frondihabitans sp. PAMC 28766]